MHKTYIKPFLCLFFLSISYELFSQNVGINTSGATPSANAILDLNTGNASQNLGVIIPSVTLGASLLTFNPPIANAATAGDVGMMVYNSSNANQPIGYYCWEGAATGWVLVSAGANNGLTLSVGNIQLGGTLNQATTITQAGNTLSITGGAINLDNNNGALALSIGAGTTTGTVGIANGTTGGNAITIGNTNGATSLAENVGTGNYTLNGVGASTYTIGSSATTGTYALGGTTQTGAITLGQSTATNTINIGNANTTTGNTQKVNIGAGTGAGTGDAIVTIGDTNAASTTNIRSGSGATIVTYSKLAANGGVALNTTGALPNASAALDIESTTKGFLPPQMTTTQMNAISSPATGLVIYNSTTGCLELYSNGVWNQTGCPCTAPPAEPGAITGSTNPCASSTGQIYSISAITGAFLYNWSIPPGATITSGTNTTSITITFGTTSGNLSVSATNSCGSSLAYSEAISLIATPSVTVQPSNTTLCTTGTAIFSITATGALLTYQWYESTVGSGSWHSITNGTFGGVTYSGATTSSLSVATPTAAMNGNQYYCIVSGECTPTASSNTVTMSVNSLPAIAVQPTNSTVCNNATTTFSVTATGTAPTYQWQESTNGGVSYSALSNSATFGGVTTATLTITTPGTGMSGTEYECVVSGTCAPSVTSTAATLTVNAAPVVTASPSAQSVCFTTGTPAYSVTATGATSYQWEEYVSSWNPISNGAGSSGQTYAGALTSSLSITNVPLSMSGNQYECIVSGAGGCSATSSAAALTVYQTYLPITLTNSQTTATSANFQQMITINSSTYNAYESGGLQNVEFTTGPGGTGTPLYAWIETGATNASASTIYWVNLGTSTIAASGGTLTIYMNFMNSVVMTGTTGYTGEAPNLFGGANYATAYGQYDNGAKVFTQYGGASWASFTTILGTWSSAGGPLQQTSAAGTASSGGPAALIEGTTYAANGSYVLGEAFSYTTQADARIGIAAVMSLVGSPATDAEGYRFLAQNSAGTTAGFISFLNDLVAWKVNGAYQGVVATPYTMVITDFAGTWSGNLYSGYGAENTAALTSLASTAYTTANEQAATTGYVGISASYSGTTANPITVQWFYMRQDPPNNTMPTVAPGAVTCP